MLGNVTGLNSAASMDTKEAKTRERFIQEYDSDTELQALNRENTNFYIILVVVLKYILNFGVSDCLCTASTVAMERRQLLKY